MEIIPPRLAPRRRTVVAALLAIAAVAVALGVIVTGTSGSGPGNGTGSGSSTGGFATVRRRNLIATDTESGTLGYAESETVYDRLSGTITSLPSVGQVIRPGQSLYRVDDKPVVLFDGSTPAFRDLESGVSDGPDVYELNRALVRLGFDTQHLITIDDVWQAGTTDAVDLWQASLGEPETGIIALGQVVFLPGAQRITAVDTVLGSTGQSAGGASSGAGSTAASSAATPVVPRAEFVSLETKDARGKSAPRAAASGDSAAVLSALQALLKAETAEQNSRRKKPSPAAGKSSASKSSGSGSADTAPAQAVLETASTKLVVSVQLNATNQSEAIVGERVGVELPDGSTVGGRVTQVSAVAQSSSSSANSGGNGGGGGGSGAPTATIPVTVALTGRHRSLAGLDQAAVSVNFVQQQARHVLSVPVTALLATAGGGYDVQEAQSPHRLIPVTPGLFAAGYVQVSGAGTYDGLQVTDSQG